MVGVYNTLDIPLRKSPDLNETAYNDYFAFYMHSPENEFSYALLKPRHIAEAAIVHKKVRGVIEDFKAVPINNVFFGKIIDGEHIPHTVKYTYIFSGRTIRSLDSYTLG